MGQQGRGWITAGVVAQLAFGLFEMTVCLPSMQVRPAPSGATRPTVQLNFRG